VAFEPPAKHTCNRGKLVRLGKEVANEMLHWLVFVMLIRETIEMEGMYGTGLRVASPKLAVKKQEQVILLTGFSQSPGPVDRIVNAKIFVSPDKIGMYLYLNECIFLIFYKIDTLFGP